MDELIVSFNKINIVKNDVEDELTNIFGKFSIESNNVGEFVLNKENIILYMNEKKMEIEQCIDIYFNNILSEFNEFNENLLEQYRNTDEENIMYLRIKYNIDSMSYVISKLKVDYEKYIDNQYYNVNIILRNMQYENLIELKRIYNIIEKILAVDEFSVSNLDKVLKEINYKDPFMHDI